MSILNVNQIQPVGGGNTITVNASDVSASGVTITASSFVGPVTGNVTGNVTSSSTSTFSSGINVTGGRVLIGTTNAGSNGTADDLVVANNGSASDQAGITIRGGTSGRSQIFFSDGTSGDAEYRGMLRYDHSDESMQFRTAATERLRIDSGGDVKINNGNLILTTAGKGISFINAADTATGETVTSSVLDDYEEGTWTPTWHGTLNSGTWAATGTYTKIGRTVTIQMAQTGGDVTFTVGGWIVGGLPFTPTNGQTGAAGDITDMSPSFGGIVSLQGSTRIYSAVAASNKTTLRINATFQV